MVLFGVPILVVLFLGLLAAILAVVLAIVTEGRYFGKAISNLVYDRLGPAIFQEAAEAERWDALANALQLEAGSRLLDIGTALGGLPIRLAEIENLKLRTYGVELSPSMTTAAASRATKRGLTNRVSFVLADASDPLPFRSGSFGAVSALGVLEGMKSPDRTLAEMHRVLEPDGSLVLSIYSGLSSILVALSEGWYTAKLNQLGNYKTELQDLRRTHKILIAKGKSA